MNGENFSVRFLKGFGLVSVELFKENLSPYSELKLFGQYANGEDENKLFFIEVNDVVSVGKSIVSFNFSLPMLDRPVKRILLFLYDDYGEEKRLHLFDKLFPSNDSEFNKQFIRKVQRTNLPQLDYYIANQVVRFFNGSDCYRCCSAVVKAYKAIEIGVDELLTDALTSLDHTLVLCENIDEDWHPRRSGIHLYFSLLCARWHLCLALGNQDEFLKSLNAVMDKSAELHESSFHTAGYPISISVAMKVLFFSFVRNEDVWADSDYCSWVFKKTVQDSHPRKITLFDELKVSHNSTLVCMKVASKQIDLDDSLVLKKVFSTLLRVKGKAADRLFSNFLKMHKSP